MHSLYADKKYGRLSCHKDGKTSVLYVVIRYTAVVSEHPSAAGPCVSAVTTADRTRVIPIAAKAHEEVSGLLNNADGGDLVDLTSYQTDDAFIDIGAVQPTDYYTDTRR
jgi:hypothetical protein